MNSVDPDQALHSETLIYLHCLFVLNFYGPVKPMGHVERSQFT